MRLENIAIRLRPRSPWEAVDLGRVMLGAWRGAAWRAWSATYVLFGLPLLLLLWDYPSVGILILWWLKPLFDRPLLFAFSRSLFGQDTSVRDVWHALPGLLRGPGLVSALTLRRLSLARSFLLPVWQLEGQRGAEARARFRVLAARYRGYAVWLTFVCANVASALGVALLVLLQMFVPAGHESPFSLQQWLSGLEDPGWLFLMNLAVMAADSLIEPFYVASGFALYLTRRSELEGWDIELAFRRLAERREAERRPATSTGRATLLAGLFAAAVLATGLQPGQAHAQEEEDDAPSQQCESPAATPRRAPGAARTAIDDVLKDPVFGAQRTEKEWHRRDPKKESPAALPEWLKLVARLAEILSQGLRWVVWIGAVVAIALLVYLLHRYRDAWIRPGRPRTPPPEFLFGLDVRADSLPTDVAGTALGHLGRGEITAALSLLYRGALVALIHQRQVEFHAGDTESECLARTASHLDEAARGYFAELLAGWRLAAYAHEPPSGPAVESLCRRWPEHFSRPAEQP